MKSSLFCKNGVNHGQAVLVAVSGVARRNQKISKRKVSIVACRSFSCLATVQAGEQKQEYLVGADQR